MKVKVIIIDGIVDMKKECSICHFDCSIERMMI